MASREEKIIDPKTVTQQSASFRKIERDYVKKAGEAKKPLCCRCLKFDYDKNQVKDWTEYTKGEVLKIEKVKDSKTHKVLGKMTDYLCPNGHGMSFEDLIDFEEGMVPTLPSALKR